MSNETTYRTLVSDLDDAVAAAKGKSEKINDKGRPKTVERQCRRYYDALIDLGATVEVWWPELRRALLASPIVDDDVDADKRKAVAP